MPVTAVDDTAPTADEDSVEDQPQQRGLMIPASMGLRFQIPLDLDAFTVRASWGTYDPEASDEGDRVRHGRSGSSSARPIDDPESIAASPTCRPAQTDDVPARRTTSCCGSTATTTPTATAALIEVALCNDRETPPQIPINAWLFQTQLHVEAGGEAVFLPVRRRAASTTEVERDAELRRLNLQYRDRLEFAIGRTCSVDWDGRRPGAPRATAVWTTWLPICETPQTRPRRSTARCST